MVDKDCIYGTRMVMVDKQKGMKILNLVSTLASVSTITVGVYH